MAAAQLRLNRCIAEIRSWMFKNKLKLNDSKTELFLISSPRCAAGISHLTLNIGGSVVRPSASIKNLGIVFDNSLTMNSHVSSLCRSVNFHIRNIARIRRFIDQTTCAHAARSLILSRLDYGNSLLCGLPKQAVQRLQKLQNRAARLIFQVSKRTSAAPLLRELHWLPVQQRIDFKILVHVYNCLHDSSPSYLQDRLHKYRCNRTGLRSMKDLSRLEIPKTKRAYGDRSFSAYGPKLWNSLPNNVRDAPNVKAFKKLLKTYLFPN